MSKEDDDKKREQKEIIKGVFKNLEDPEFLAALELVRNANSSSRTPTCRPDQEVTYVESRKRPSTQREEDSLPKPKVKIEEIEEGAKQEKIDNQLNTGKLTQNSQQEGLQPIQKEVQKDTPITTQSVQEQQPPERQPVITERPRTQPEETQTEIGDDDNTPVEVTEFKTSKEQQEKERIESDTQFKSDTYTGMRSITDFARQLLVESHLRDKYNLQQSKDIAKHVKFLEDSVSQSNISEASYKGACASFIEYDKQYLNTNIGREISAVQSNQVYSARGLSSMIQSGFNNTVAALDKVVGVMTQFNDRLKTMENNQQFIYNDITQMKGTVNAMDTKLNRIIEMQGAFGNASVNLQMGNVTSAMYALNSITDMNVEHRYYIPKELQMEIEDKYEDPYEGRSVKDIYDETLGNIQNFVRQELIVNPSIETTVLLNKMRQNESVLTLMNTLLRLNANLRTDSKKQRELFENLVQSVKEEMRNSRPMEIIIEETRQTQENLRSAQLNAIGILETYYNYLINNNIVQSPEEYKLIAIKSGSALPSSFDENINEGTMILNNTVPVPVRGNLLEVMKFMYNNVIQQRAKATEVERTGINQETKKNILFGRKFLKK